MPKVNIGGGIEKLGKVLPLPELMDMELPERVAWVRGVILRLTQAEFAAAVGVSSRTVKGWEHPDLPRGAPVFKHARVISELVGGLYPPELFMEAGALETAIALRIERKLDLIMAHLGIEDE